MSRLLALIVLCGMSISVLSDDDLKDCIFDFEYYEPARNSNDIILDFSELVVSTLKEGSMTYHYITGEFKTRSKVDSSIQANYTITKFGQGNVIEGSRDVCNFTANVYSQYLMPFAGYRDDKPPNTTICHRDPSTIIHVMEASNSKDLVAKSKLDEGKYSYVLSYMKDDRHVGGMGGVFNVIRV